MTEAVVADAATAEASTAARGRPRPDETKERDEKVFAAIAGSDRPVTREEIANGTGLAGNLAYLSLYRLNRAERVQRTRDGGKHVWSVREPAVA